MTNVLHYVIPDVSADRQGLIRNLRDINFTIDSRLRHSGMTKYKEMLNQVQHDRLEKTKYNYVIKLII